MLPHEVAEEDGYEVVIGSDEAAEQPHELSSRHSYEDGQCDHVDLVVQRVLDRRAPHSLLLVHRIFLYYRDSEDRRSGVMNIIRSLLGVLVLRHKWIYFAIGGDALLETGGMGFVYIAGIVDISILLAFLGQERCTEKKYRF